MCLLCSYFVLFSPQGFEILEELEEAVSKKKPKNTLQMLSSKFYTAIPHDFGRRVPPVIDTAEDVQMKYDMLAVGNHFCRASFCGTSLGELCPLVFIHVFFPACCFWMLLSHSLKQKALYSFKKKVSPPPIFSSVHLHT